MEKHYTIWGFYLYHGASKGYKRSLVAKPLKGELKDTFSEGVSSDTKELERR
jgi:hypothetical protein